MKNLIIALMVISIQGWAANESYSDIPVKNMPDETPLPIYRPEQSAKEVSAPTSEVSSSRTTSRKVKIPPVTTRFGMGGTNRNDLPNADGGISFNFAAEFRFHEPYSIIPRIQYSSEKAFFGLRERGGLPSTRTNLETPEDTKMQEWLFGANFGMELTPQDGFFHFIPSAGPFYRTAKLTETSEAMKGRTAFSGSELRARGFGLNINLTTAFDIYDRYGFFVNGNWDVILDPTQRYTLKESEPVNNSVTRPGLNANDVESLEKNALSWQIGFQARF
mgnify:CR=1 FL=1